MRVNPSTAIVCQPLLDGAECDALLEHLAGADWQDGRVAVPGYGGAVQTDIRRMAHVELEPAKVSRVLRFLEDLNRAFYAFELTGASPSDPLLAMRYQPGDHFDWHIDDATEAVATRKLSFSVQLSDPDAYAGGDLEFAQYTLPAYASDAATRAPSRRRGAVIVFPSFHLHRVSPVTRGTRIALVGWLHGPRFR